MQTHPIKVTATPDARVLLGLATLLLAGCYGTTQSPYASEYPTGQTVYADANGRPVYADANGRPVYSSGQPSYQYGQPGYPGQPVYSTNQPVDQYGNPISTSSYAAPDDYVYYPEAEVYYSTSRREYIYPQSGGWVRRQDAPRVSVWGPSVHLTFRDGPERHHAEVMRQYPRNWHPGRPDQRRERRDRDHDDDRDGDRR